MKLEEAIRIMDLFVKNIAVENVKVFELKDACKVALQELEHLQKENEELKNGNKGFIPVKKIENKIREYFEYDKKYKTYTSDGRENYTYEYYKALTLQDLLREVFEND